MKRKMISAFGLATLIIGGCGPADEEQDFAVRDFGACNFEGRGPPEEFAYVVNRGSGTVSVVDPRRCELLTTIEVGGEPVKANASASGKYVYVANFTNDLVTIIDTDINEVVQELPTIEEPHFVQFSSDHRVIWVFGDGADVDLLNVKDNEMQGRLNVGAGPKSLTMNESFPYKAYVALEDEGIVEVFDTSDYTLVTTLPVGDNPTGIDFSDWSSNAYVCTDAGLEVISTEGATAESVIKTIPLSARCDDITFDPTGRFGWVTLKDTAGLVVIDAQTDELHTELNLPGPIEDLAFFRPTSQVMAVAQSSEAQMFDADDFVHTRTVEIEAGPHDDRIDHRDMIESLDRRHAYIANPRDNTMTIYDTLRQEVRGKVSVGDEAYFIVVAGPGGGSCCD